MKVIGSVQEVSPDSMVLDMTAHIATALGARFDATLYAVGFRREIVPLRLGQPLSEEEPERRALTREWQAFLKRHVLRSGQPAYLGPVTEVYDHDTAEATKAFQRDQVIDDDGEVGRQTLNRAFRSGFRTTSTAPVATIIASPFPTSSWSKLLRLSVIRESKPRSAHALLRALRSLGLACRFIEVIQPIALGNMELFTPRHVPRYSATSPRSSSNAVMTPIDAVIELSAKLDSTPDGYATTFPMAIHAASRQLQETLRQLIENAHSHPDGADVAQARDQLTGAFESLRTAGVVEGFTRVASLKPMHTLNALAARYAKEDRLGWAREKIRIGRRERKRSRSKTLTFDVSPWHALLWHQSEQLPDERPEAAENAHKLLAISYADSEEKLVCWNFFDLRQRVVAEFDVAVPSDISDFVWREWVYEVVGASGGDVISSYTSPRLRDGVLVCALVVVFPFVESVADGGVGDVARLLECFDELLGSRGHGTKFNELRKRMPRTYHHAAQHALGSVLGEELLKGTANHTRIVLSPVRMWSPPVDPDALVALPEPHSPSESGRPQPTKRTRYRDRFKSNPFAFTRPMTLATYDAVYDSTAATSLRTGPFSRQKDTRRAVATQIVQSLVLRNENVAVIGAHRCGKSTVLNMVEDMLLKEPSAQSSPGRSDGRHSSAPPTAAAAQRFIPIRINAAITPVSEFHQAIAEGLIRSAEVSGPRTNLIETVRDAFTAVLRSDAQVEIAVPGMKIAAGGGEKPDPRSIEEYLANARTASTTKSIRDALRWLNDALTRTGKSETWQAEGPPCALVIIDEVGDGVLLEKSDAATAAWRSVMESSTYEGIRWLVASTRPMHYGFTYSPVSNVFREQNLGCLSEEEAHRLLDAFGSTQEGKLSPVLTPRAREALLAWTGRLPFILQVASSYLFERATTRELPVITESMCKRTLSETVAMQMSDYFSQQWLAFGEDIQSEIMQALSVYKRPLDALTLEQKSRPVRFRPASRRALSRSGFEDAEGGIAPLAAFWLLSTVANGTSERPQRVDEDA